MQRPSHRHSPFPQVTDQPRAFLSTTTTEALAMTTHPFRELVLVHLFSMSPLLQHPYDLLQCIEIALAVRPSTSVYRVTPLETESFPSTSWLSE